MKPAVRRLLRGTRRPQIIFAGNAMDTPKQEVAVGTSAFQVTRLNFWTGSRPCKNPTIYFANWYVSSTGATGEVSGTGTLTIKASFEVDGQTPAQHGSTLILAPGESGSLTFTGIELPANTKYWVRTYVQHGGVNKLDCYDTISASGTGAVVGAGALDEALLTTLPVAASTTTQVYGPWAATAEATDRLTAANVLLIGDSISYGMNEANGSIGDGRRNRGYIARGLDSAGVRLPFLKVSRASSSTLSAVGSVFAKRRVMVPYATHIIVQHGENDTGFIAATMEANLVTLWDELKSTNPNAKIIQALLGPRTSSTDSFATVVNQTAAAANAYVDPLTTTQKRFYVRQQMGAYVGTRLVATIDPLPYWQADTTTNRDRWNAPGFTTDGLHPSATAHDAAKQCVIDAYNSGVFNL